MKNCKTLPQNLFLKAVLLLFVSAVLFTTLQEVPASVDKIVITSNAGSDDTYKVGDTIEASVKFDRDVNVTLKNNKDKPYLTLKIGTADRNADFKSSIQADVLAFVYTVAAGDVDTDGIEIKANSLTLNLGTITDTISGELVDLTHKALPVQASHKVDGVVPTIATTNGIAITSTPTSNNTYKTGDKIQATVTFSERAIVTGTPQLTLQIGSATKIANYITDSEPAALMSANFEYTVAAGDTDADGISIGADALSLNGGTIKDVAGNAATLTHTALSAQASHKVDGVAPTVAATNGIAITSTAPANNTYKKDDTIQATVTFSESVNVTGTPRLLLQIGDNTTSISYLSGSGTKGLVFTYTVVNNNVDTDGISIAANVLSLNGGTIKDAAGNAAILTHTAVPADSAHKVDGIVPSINNIAFTSTTAPYTVGEVVQATVTFTENVVVTGTPQLALQFQVTKKPAAYKSGSGTTALVFEYTVVAGNAAPDGIAIGANALSLNSGTISDAAGNAATLTHTAVSNDSNHKVDATVPTIATNGISITSTTAHYTAGEAIQATVTFTENVSVTGTPQLTLQIGSATKTAGYASGSGTAALVFAYTVADGDTDIDGISIAANALSLNSGTIGDAAENAAVLTHTAVPADSAHQVDTTTPSIDTIAFTSTTAPYTAGEVVQTTVTFDEKVFVTGTPQLALQFSVLKKPAAYKSGSGTAALVFEYTVVAGEKDDDGISIDADSLTLNGGTIKDAIGNTANLTHTAIPAQTAHIVDTDKPRVNALRISSTPTNNTYKAGDVIQVTVDWSKAVTVTGSPTIALSMEREIRTLSYKSGSDSKTLVFEYTVTAGDTDETGIGIGAGQIELGNGVKITQKDETTVDAVLNHSGLADDASHKVDTTAPEIVSNGVTITSATAPYTADEVIQATVTFTENVTVTDTPQLTLQIGDATKAAAYKSGTGTTVLLFEYTVVAGDADADGISIGANALALNSGTITDAAGNAATLTHTALPAQASHTVDATAPTIDTDGIAITSTATNNIYTAGDTIQATVTFTENVDVAGTPQLELRIGTADKNAAWTSGTGTTVLAFEYTVVASDVDADGIEIRADKLTLNGGTIQDAAGNAATLTYNALSAQASHKVDGTVPAINGIAITSTPTSNNTYKTGDKVQVRVAFTENMVVTDTPQLALQIGNATKNANYASGSGTAALVFEYTVAAGDTDADGISIGANALSLNNGTITDTTGNAAVLTHTAVSDASAHQVDGILPKIVSNGVAITSTTAPYMAGEVIQATVTFNEDVIVTGTPQLTLQIGTDTKKADYASGSNTTMLLFEYTVVAGDAAPDGISITADALTLNSDTIRDASGNDADLTHTRVAANASHKVDAVQPTLKSIQISSSAGDDATYMLGNVIEMSITMSEAVNVTGTPQLTLTIGTQDRVADYASGTGTAVLVFEYTVATGDTDANGISIDADALTLNSDTITDAVGNTADLRHSAVSHDSGHKVDTEPPKIVSGSSDDQGASGAAGASGAVGFARALNTVVVSNGVEITSSGPYGTGDVVQITVTFSERVRVTGSPEIELQVGGTTKNAGYQSGDETDEIIFAYTIVSGDADVDGISVRANSIQLNGGSITDIPGNSADLKHSEVSAASQHIVDTTLLKISSVAFSTTGPYKISDRIEVTLTTIKPVTVTGSATLKIIIGHTEKPARYHSGSGTNTLVFQYTVASGDGDDSDGVSVRANSLSLNGGTIVDEFGTALNLSHDALPDGGNSQRVDTTLPQVSSLAFTSTGPYGASDNIEVTLTTSEAVEVTGTPTLGMTIGTTQRAARLFAGAGTSTLVFRYEVTATDGDDTNGVSVSANSLSLNGGTIVDALGTPLNLNHNPLPDAGEGHRVDTTSPQVSSVAFTSTGPYGVGNDLEVTVTTSETVKVIGTPTLGMTIGTTQRVARFFSGTGTSTLVFRYKVTTADEDDADGVSVNDNSLALNGGSITDGVGNTLNLNHSGIADAGNTQIVRTTIPSIHSVAFTSTGPYGISDNIEVTVTTTKSMIVTGSATLEVLIGHTEKPARYHSGSGTNTLVFQYTVTSGDGDDTNGVSVRANSLSRNGGTIVDELGTALNLNHDALADAGERQSVDTTLPQVSSLAFSSTGPYSVGSAIQVTVTTSEAVTVVGRPTLIIVIGSTERTAHFLNSGGTTTLVFGYRITAADKDDTNGVSVKANSLTLNGGTITDSVGNALNLNHSGIANAGDAQIVGTTVSDIRSLAFTSTGPYAVDDTITVTVEATEKVTVTGVPRIPMTLGTATKYANYVSGSETTSLVFQYTVVTGDEDADGVEIAPNVLENHNGSKIENSYRTALNLNHPGVAADPKQKVDTTPPSITSVDFVGDAQAVYTAGSKIEVEVTFEETDVAVKSTAGTDMPSVTLLFGDNSAADSRKTEVEAYYTEARPGSTKLVFTYTVTSDTPIDTDGIQIKSRSLKIPAGASIQDASGNAIRATQAADGSAMVNIRVLRRTTSRPVLPAVTSTGIIFNEFLNADRNKEDWVELRNITDGEISLGGWELNLSSTLSMGTDTFEFPEMTLPAGTVLLLVNTGHKETRLEHSQAYTYRYLSVPELHLPASNFSLILRDRSKAIADVVGDYFGNTEASDTPIVFGENQAYFREQPNTPGYEAAAWQQSGYQGGLGYDRKTAKDLSLGTPGYLKRTLTQPSATVPVSISEIMFTPGKSERLPQWIELYNGSKTDVVTLQGWRLQVEGYDPTNKPTHRFVTLIIHNALRILPKQTVLLVTKNGRHSDHFPEQRVYNLTEQHSDKLEQLGPNGQLLGEVGYAVVLRDESGNQVDIVGNLDGEGSTNDEPSWKLPNCIDRDGVRTSIIRQYEDGVPLTGTRKSSWFRAITTNRRIIIYWGDPKDIGYPGWKKGGPLPVQLSSFSADRTEQGAVIKWTTQSELENAGFNVLRSDTRTGTFKVVNSRMLQGAGTTSERHTYQYVDTTAKAGVAYHYRLEEVSFAGVRQPVATRRLRGHVSAANRYLTTFGSIKRTE